MGLWGDRMGPGNQAGEGLPACVPPSMTLKLSLSHGGKFSKSAVLKSRMTWSWLYSDTSALIVVTVTLVRQSLRGTSTGP